MWHLGSGAPPRINLVSFFCIEIVYVSLISLGGHYLLFVPEFWTSLWVFAVKTNFTIFPMLGSLHVLGFSLVFFFFVVACVYLFKICPGGQMENGIKIESLAL